MERVEELKSQGLKAYKSNDLPTALALFQAAYTESQSRDTARPDLASNIASTLFELGQYPEAAAAAAHAHDVATAAGDAVRVKRSARLIRRAKASSSARAAWLSSRKTNDTHAIPALSLRPDSLPPIVRPPDMPGFKFYPVGHDAPVFLLSKLEAFCLVNNRTVGLAHEPLWYQDQPSRMGLHGQTRIPDLPPWEEAAQDDLVFRVCLAAASDTRHVIATLLHLHTNDLRDDTSLEIFFNDINPASVARSILVLGLMFEAHATGQTGPVDVMAHYPDAPPVAKPKAYHYALITAILTAHNLTHSQSTHLASVLQRFSGHASSKASWDSVFGTALEIDATTLGAIKVVWDQWATYIGSALSSWKRPRRDTVPGLSKGTHILFLCVTEIGVLDQLPKLTQMAGPNPSLSSVKFALTPFERIPGSLDELVDAVAAQVDATWGNGGVTMTDLSSFQAGDLGADDAKEISLSFVEHLLRRHFYCKAQVDHVAPDEDLIRAELSTMEGDEWQAEATRIIETYGATHVYSSTGTLDDLFSHVPRLEKDAEFYAETACTLPTPGLFPELASLTPSSSFDELEQVFHLNPTWTNPWNPLEKLEPAGFDPFSLTLLSAICVNDVEGSIGGIYDLALSNAATAGAALMYGSNREVAPRLRIVCSIGDYHDLLFRMKENSLDRLLVSNVPDYAGWSPLFTLLRPIMRVSDEGVVFGNCLKCPPVWESYEHLIESTTRLAGEKSLAMYGLEHALGPNPSSDAGLVGQHLTVSLLAEPEFGLTPDETYFWLSRLLLASAYPHTSSTGSAPLELVTRTTVALALWHLVVRVGRPAHTLLPWLKDVFETGAVHSVDPPPDQRVLPVLDPRETFPKRGSAPKVSVKHVVLDLAYAIEVVFGNPHPWSGLLAIPTGFEPVRIEAPDGAHPGSMQQETALELWIVFSETTKLDQGCDVPVAEFAPWENFTTPPFYSTIVEAVEASPDDVEAHAFAAFSIAHRKYVEVMLPAEYAARVHESLNYGEEIDYSNGHVMVNLLTLVQSVIPVVSLHPYDYRKPSYFAEDNSMNPLGMPAHLVQAMNDMGMGEGLEGLPPMPPECAQS